MTRMLHPVQFSQADSGEEVVGARMFKPAKDSAVKSRTQTINQLQAVLVSADPATRPSALRSAPTQARGTVWRPRRDRRSAMQTPQPPPTCGAGRRASG